MSHIWLDGLTFTNTSKPMPSGAADSDDYTAIFACLLNAGYDTGYQNMTGQRGRHHDHALDRSTDTSTRFAAGRAPTDWVVADNTIVGNRTLGMTARQASTAKAIEIGGGSQSHRCVQQHHARR